jgi:uncharacterized protein
VTARAGAPLSPCVSVCVLDPDTGWCRGCCRTIEEIAHWLDYDAEQRWRVIDAVAARRGERKDV